MIIDWHIVQALALIIGISFVFGAPLKWKVSNIPFLCLPSVGIVFFSGLIVPVLYFVGGWNPYVLYGAAVSLLGLGLISLFLIIKAFRPARPTLFSAVMLILLIIIVAGFIVQGSRYAVPGGIDPAIHSLYVSNIVQSDNFNVSYPLGMHILILSIENISTYSMPTIMKVLQIFFVINIFIIAYYIIKTLSSNKIAGMIGVSAIIFDTSIYNNYLNGSITHLLAVLLILISILLILFLPNNNKRLCFIIITVFYVSVFYFHFITLFMLMPVLWLLRAYSINKQHWSTALAFPVSLLVAAPLLINFINISGFQTQFIVACLMVFLIDAGILLFNERIKQIFFNNWVQFIYAIIGLLAFKKTLSAFDIIPEWYEMFILTVATIGIIIIILKKMRSWYPIVMYFSVVSILYFFIDLAHLRIDTPIFKELIFYYGFTAPLVLLGAAGIYYGLQLISTRMIKTTVIAVLFVIAILISGSRFFDEAFLSDVQAISRYGRSDGFGIFYTRDDVKVAIWAKNHLPKDVGIINPGGLYNTWASISERKVMYPIYATINSIEPEKTHRAVVALLTNQDSSCPKKLLDQKFQYLLIPSLYQAYFRNACVSLLYESGNARLFKINDLPSKSVKFQAINLSNLEQNTAISLSGNFNQKCIYCGNRFYYQFEDVARFIQIPPNGKLNINITRVDADRNINFLVDSQNSYLDVNLIGRDVKKLQLSDEYILKNYSQKKGEEISLQLKNGKDYPVGVYSIVLEIF